MSSLKYVASNFGNTTLAGNLISTSTSFSVYTGQGSRLPVINDGGTDNNQYTQITLQKTDGTKEIVNVVRHDTGSDAFTIGVPGTVTGSTSGRAQGGTTATSWSIGDVVSCRPTADLMELAVNLGDNITAADAKTAIHDDDKFGLSDSEASDITKKTTWANIKSLLTTLFDAAYLSLGGGTVTGDVTVAGHVTLGAGKTLIYEGTTDDAHELTVSPGEPTADRTQTHQDASGTLALIESNQAQTGIAYTTGGTSTAYTLTPTPAITALAENQEFDVEFNAAAGATPTLAISGQTAKLLKYRDSTGAKQAVTATQVPIGWRSKVVYDGTDYIVREVPPAAAALTLATPQATTSGVAIDFSSIPAGTKRITAVLDGVSTSGNSSLLMKFGTAGGIQTSTYVGECYGGQNGGAQTLGTWANGVGLQHAAIVDPADVLRGVVTFTLMDSANNIWGVSGLMYRTGAAASHNSVIGTVTLSGAVTTLRLTTAGGSDTFDAGSMNIAYE